MSAFLCNDSTVDAILTAHLLVSAAEDPNSEASVVVDQLLERGPLGAIRALEHAAPAMWLELSRVGSTMIEANVRSVEGRYPRSSLTLVGGAGHYVFRPLAVDDTIAAVWRALGAIACWKYQACEHRDSAQEAGWHFVEELRERIFETFGLVGDGVGWDVESSDHLLAERVYSRTCRDNEAGRSLDEALARWNTRAA